MFMHIIGRTLGGNHIYIIIIQFNAVIGNQVSLLPSTQLDARIHSIALNVMAGRNWNITQCSSEPNSVLPKTALRMIVHSTIP